MVLGLSFRIDEVVVVPIAAVTGATGAAAIEVVRIIDHIENRPRVLAVSLSGASLAPAHVGVPFVSLAHHIAVSVGGKGGRASASSKVQWLWW
jgi:hypothetical protein